MKKRANRSLIMTAGRILFFAMTVSTVVRGQVEINKFLPNVVLQNDSGGKINRTPWKSSELKDALNLILYVAPSQQESVEPLLKKIDSLKISREKLKVTLIINTEATWIPDGIITGKVEKKANEDTSKTYVLDKDEVLLESWNLSEDNPNIILVNDSGKVNFLSKEELDNNHQNKLLSIIENKINKEAK